MKSLAIPVGAALAAIALLGTLPAFAQPDTPAAQALKPIPQPAEPVVADKLDLAKLKVPRGFNLELYVSGIANAGTMRLGDKGTLFVGSTSAGAVYAVVEKDGKREVKTIATGLNQPSGLAFKDGTLYVAETSKITKYEGIEDKLDEPPAPTVVTEDLPKDETHGARFLGIGPDNKLYVSVGMPCNNCLPSEQHGVIRRMKLDGSDMEVFAGGVRNARGFDWHPDSKALYFTDNGRDWLSEDLPADELNLAKEKGQSFGAPYCYQGNVLDSEFGWGRNCDEFVGPVALLGPHTAPLGLRFYTGNVFPRQYREAIFIARHGSWNRTKKVGGDVLAVQLNRDGSVNAVEPFLTGFIQDNAYIGRPTDVVVLKDGSLLVSDDYAGAIYRVTYGRSRGETRKRRR